MSARKGLIIFLVKHRKLILTRVPQVLDDFLEEKYNLLSSRDLQEIERIKKQPERITRSYLHKMIEPFILPFYSRE